MAPSMSAVPHTDRPGRWRAALWRYDTLVTAQEWEEHLRLLAEGNRKSGRHGPFVYYWGYGRQCWRLHVIPKDPRTPAQQRCRAAFGAASRAWSENQPLTQDQRDAWYAAAARLKTHPRLTLSGPMTPQQYFVGRNSVKERWGLALLTEPPRRNRALPRARQPRRLAKAPACARRERTTPPPSLPPRAGMPAQKTLSTLARTPVSCPRRLLPASSDCPRTAPRLLPVHCRWHIGSLRCLGSIGLPKRSSTLAHIRRKARFRELWRGG
jgi:hypothetical protein